MRQLSHWASLLTGLLLATAADPGKPAASQEARIEVAIDTALIPVGGRMTLTASVEHDPASVVVWPGLDSLGLAPFEALDGRSSTRSTDAGLVSTLTLTLTAWELGELELPGIRAVLEQADSEVDTLVGDAFVIEVASAGIDEGGDIREIRGPLALPEAWWSPLYWIVPGALAAIAAYLLWRRFRRKGVLGFAGPAESPEERALAELDRIGRSPMLARGMTKRYHVEVSETLRRYVGSRFTVDALEMTTRELMSSLARAQPTAVLPADRRAGWLERLRTALSECDMVKFAKLRPSRGRSVETLAAGRLLVLDVVEALAEHAARASEGGDASGTARESGAEDVSSTAGKSESEDASGTGRESVVGARESTADRPTPDERPESVRRVASPPLDPSSDEKRPGVERTGVRGGAEAETTGVRSGAAP